MDSLQESRLDASEEPISSRLCAEIDCSKQDPSSSHFIGLTDCYKRTIVLVIVLVDGVVGWEKESDPFLDNVVRRNRQR